MDVPEVVGVFAEVDGLLIPLPQRASDESPASALMRRLGRLPGAVVNLLELPGVPVALPPLLVSRGSSVMETGFVGLIGLLLVAVDLFF